MRKVLFIAYDFPPCSSVGGSIRSEKFAKYLTDFDWIPTVISYTDDQVFLEEIYPDVIRLKSLTPFKKPYELRPYGWAVRLYHAGKKLLKEKAHDLIYVSCPPFPQAVAAVFLKLRSRIPLVIDLRDAWSLDPYKEGSRLKKIAYSRFFPFLESFTFHRAGLIITNTPSALSAYRDKYPHLSDKIVLLPNGFDEEDFSGYITLEQSDKMKILYCGRFQIGARNPIYLLNTIKSLAQEGYPISLTIMGDHKPELIQLIEKLGIQSNISITGQVTHQEAINAMRRSHLLVLYQERSTAQVTPIAGKTYEYLRTGRPILVIAPPGDNIDIVTHYAKCYEAVSNYETESIMNAIKKLYRGWKKDMLNTTTPSCDYVKKYNHAKLASELAENFNKVVTKN